MTRVLIVYASRHGGSAGIADRIGETLEAAGLEVLVRAASKMPSPESFDGCVVGAGVYMGSWVKEGTEYLARFADSLALRPVWLFSSGPLPGSSRTTKAPTDPIELALGPATGPGSGGRRRIDELAHKIGPRDHRVFDGALTRQPAPRHLRAVRPDVSWLEEDPSGRRLPGLAGDRGVGSNDRDGPTGGRHGRVTGTARPDAGEHLWLQGDHGVGRASRVHW